MLEIRNITKQYGNAKRGMHKGRKNRSKEPQDCQKMKKALDDVSLTLTEGVYGLLGPNGAGKSTLMNITTDNLVPNAGSILWNGKEIGALGREYRSLLGYAPQQQGLYESFTGRRFLSYLGTLKNIPKEELADEIERVACFVNLKQALDQSIGAYSGGMKQRLLVAQAMMGDPKLLILDEPTAGLDPRERVRLREGIARIAQGKIVLVATHVVSDVQSIAKEIIILKEGKIVAKDTVEALCTRYEGIHDLEALYMHLFDQNAERTEAMDRVGTTNMHGECRKGIRDIEIGEIEE